MPMPNSTDAAVTRKQQRQGAWHAEALVVCIGDGAVPNRILHFIK